jgi:hypothetical protein
VEARGAPIELLDVPTVQLVHDVAPDAVW